MAQMVCVVEVKLGSNTVRNEGAVLQDGDLARVFSGALDQFRKQYPNQPLMVQEGQPAPQISVSHYFKD